MVIIDALALGSLIGRWSFWVIIGVIVIVVATFFLGTFFLGVLFSSFAGLPVTELPQFEAAGIGAFAELIMESTARILTVAVALAMPILVAVFLTDLTFGLLNRTAPQIQAYFLSLPAKAIAGVWLFALGLATTIQVLAAEGVVYLQRLEELLRLMR